MNFEFLQIETSSHIRRITLNRPKKKNAFTTKGYEELKIALNSAANDDDVKICVLTGAGDFYSSGNDLNQETGDLTVEEIRESTSVMISSLVRAFYTFPKLLIAVINGPCIGIACTTAALCDIVFCSESAYFRTPFANLGICSEGCSSYTFPRIMGTSMASNMLYLNYQMTAQEAYNYHLVSKVYKKGDEDQIWNEISQHSELPMSSIKAIKKLSKKWNEATLEKVNITEMQQLSEMIMTDDHMEAMLRFFEKKKSKL